MAYSAVLSLCALLALPAFPLFAALAEPISAIPTTAPDPDRLYSVALSYERGMALLEGKGVVKDTPTAIQWLTRSANLGHRASLLQLGRIYQSNRGVPVNQEEAVKWFKIAADYGSAEAQYEMAKHCAAGQGTAWDDAKATSYYLQAAEQGMAKAQHDVAIRYDLGKGVKADKTLAAKWYLKAAQQADPDSQFNYACMLDSGEGVARNPREAVRWLKDAALQDHVRAQHNLAIHYASGVGAPRDEVLAFAWFNVAAASGLADAVKARDLAESKLGHASVLKGQEMSREFFKDILFASTTIQDLETPPLVSPEAADTPRATGSGVIVSTDGLILTAAHVVKAGSNVVVIFRGEARGASVERVDEANDLALLRITGTDLPALAMAPSTVARLGQPVAVMGYPSPGVLGEGTKVTRGEISSLNGWNDEPRDWQVSAPVQSGNSGGPLLDEQGRILGVVVSKLSGLLGTDIPQNVNYARKGAYVRAFLEPYASELVAAPDDGPAPAFADMVEKALPSIVILRVY